MKNLYEEIQFLVDERQRLNDLGGRLKYDYKCKNPKAVSQFKKVSNQYAVVDKTLKDIEDNYIIDYIKLAEILTHYTGIAYKPRIFRETYMKDGLNYYSGRFVGCYLNKKNEFFDYKLPATEVSMGEEDYNKLLNSLDATKSLVFSSSEECSFRPLVPEYYISPINFIKMFIYGKYRFDDIITRDFIETIYPVLKNKLQKTYIAENNFGR